MQPGHGGSSMDGFSAIPGDFMNSDGNNSLRVFVY